MLEVVYQYLHSASKWEELRYSLRSLDQHLKTPYRVWIVGDKPDWLTNVNHIPHQRVDSGWLNNCYDAISKLEKVLNHPEIGNELLWMYDDMYLLKDAEQIDFEQFLAVNHSTNLDHTSSGIHKEILKETFKALKAAIRSTYNCETHTPRLYSKILLKEMVLKYSPKENRYLFSTLYFNDVYNGITPTLLSKENGIKAGFYGFDSLYSYKAKTVEEIKTICARNKFLNHNDDGLTQHLVQVIEELYPTKSIFEL